MSESDRPDEQIIDGNADLDAIILDLDTAGRELPVEATFLVGLADVEKYIAEGEAGFLRWQSHCEPTGIADTIAELETWAAFRKEPPPRTPTPASRPRLAPPSGSLPPPPKLPTRRVGRNALCPCGSGKKFKKCCGSRRV